MKCTFFGHGDAPEEIRGKLKETIVDLIENKGVDTFYVGTHGNFDNMAYKALMEEKHRVTIFVVLPCVIASSKYAAYENTIVPEGLEKVPPRFGIDYRNKWMVKQSDFVIAYVKRPFGGAAKFEEYAKKQKKIVVNIGFDTNSAKCYNSPVKG